MNSNLVDCLNLGGVISLSSSSDDQSAVLGILGAAVFAPINVGPPFGTGKAGIAYRVTGEANGDPALVMRANAYFFEDVGAPTWLATINANGMTVGVHSSDTIQTPRDRLDIRRGMVRVHNDADNYSRLESTNGDTYWLFSSGAPDNANPKWAIGRGSNLIPGHGDDLIVAKFKNGSWSYVTTLATY